MVLPPPRLALSAAGRAALGCALGLVVAGAATAQEPGKDVPGRYDPAVPTVASLRGAPIAGRLTSGAEIGAVLEDLAARSDRVRLQAYGASAGGRPLRLAWISDPANLDRLDDLRAANVALALRPDASPTDGRPIFVWLSFGIHGDEPSTPEAALELVYRLTADQDPDVVRWLREAVVVVDPLLNPDGRARHLAKVAWPDGRTNGWYFDLNRDWAWGTQPETRARLAVYRSTLPQIHVDFHEMESTTGYLFAQADSPPPWYPPSTGRWARVFARAIAAAFDARGWAYDADGGFDLHYPGYGDSWPSLLGATGMTYEVARRPPAAEIGDPGDALATRIERHVTAAWTTIATAVDHRGERMADFAAFWRAGRPPGAAVGYLWPPGPGARELAGFLAAQGIEVDTLAFASGTAGLVGDRGREPAGRLPAGTFLARADQPMGRLLAALMARPEPGANGTGSDIRAWTVADLHAVDLYRSAAPPSVATGRWDPAATAAPEPPPSARGLVWRYERSEDLAAAVELARSGWPVAIAERAVGTDPRRWPRGTIVAGPAAGRSLATAAARLERHGVHATALAEPPPEPASGGAMRRLAIPRIAIAVGPGLDETSVGAMRWLLEARLGLEVALVPLDAGLVLEAFDVLVLPNAASAAAYRDDPGLAAIGRIDRWVVEGGTVVAIGHGVAALDPPAPGPAVGRRGPGPGLGRASGAGGGALVSAAVDPDSPLGLGFDGPGAPVLVRDPVRLPEDRGRVAWRYAEPPTRGAIATPGFLVGRAYATVERRGEGAIVRFADDPAFRGILPALEKALLDAILLVATPDA